MTDLIRTADLQQLKEIMEDEFDMLISLFVEDSAKLIKQIETAYQSSDAQALQIAAHTLKGSASNMCLVQVTDISKAIEYKGRENDLQGVAELIDQINSIYPETCEQLKTF